MSKAEMACFSSKHQLSKINWKIMTKLALNNDACKHKGVNNLTIYKVTDKAITLNQNIVCNFGVQTVAKYE